MKYPMINKQAQRTVNIPKLSGGLNLRDSLTGVRDNQLTDSVNMWYKDGMLKTRPPFVTNGAKLINLNQAVNGQKITTRFHEEVRIKHMGIECICATNKRVIFNNADNTFNCNIDFELHSADKIFALSSIENIVTDDDITYFLAQTKDALYCYVSDYSIWVLNYGTVSESNLSTLAWENVSLCECYIPLVMTHCKAKKINNKVEYTGTQFESYNALNNSYKMVYSTVNIAGLENGQISAEYPVLNINSEDEIYGSTFVVKHTTISGVTEEHRVKCNRDKSTTLWTETASGQKDNLNMYVSKDNMNVVVGFRQNSDNSIKMFGESDFVEDNLEITVIIPKTDNLQLKRIFGMQKTIWFGGASSGIYSGSRLFLGANSDDENKSMIVWSSLNNPLYFPENCYAYIGNKNNAVTAFNRQEDKLIIFKENEIYYTYYVYNDNITADDLINQNVVDYEANSVCFPITLLNGFIGCDCPNSVQMCKNRLVWANSCGKIYTLCKINQYDEHNIYEISAMIENKLKGCNDLLKASTSADFAGHYILFLRDCAFVADYNSYGYEHIYSYSKSDDANALLPWYYWDFSFLQSNEKTERYENACICTLNGSLLMKTFFNSSDSAKAGFVGFEMKENEFSPYDKILKNDFSSRYLQLFDNKITCSATTKLFEFGNGIYNVNVDYIDLKLGANNGFKTEVKFMSEQGEEYTEITGNRKYDLVTATNFIKPTRVYPSIRAILKLAIKLKCNGLLAIDGLSVQYRLLGGAK